MVLMSVITKFHAPVSDVLLAIIIKPKTKQKMCLTVLLFGIV
jgi:hypothetical protein